MSVETILLIGLLIVAPLIQSAVAALRKTAERNQAPEGASADAGPMTAQQPSPSPPILVDVPDLSTTTPARGIPARGTPERRSLRDSIAMLELTGIREATVLPVVPGGNARQERRRGSRFMADIRHPRALRRAMVLTAVLGPCRAMNPPD